VRILAPCASASKAISEPAGDGVVSQLVAVGRDVFALITTGVAGSAVLYRVAT